MPDLQILSAIGIGSARYRELQRRGCTIQQESYTKRANNVIRGNFARPGQLDWAVLCSINRVSSILVFFNGSEKDVQEIARMEDRTFLQGISADNRLFERHQAGREGFHYAAFQSIWWADAAAN